MRAALTLIRHSIFFGHLAMTSLLIADRIVFNA